MLVGGAALHFGEPFADFVHRARVFEGRRIADLLAGDERPDHATHDLPAPRFGQFVRDIEIVGHRDRANLPSHVIAQLLSQRIRAGLAALEDHVRDEGLLFQRVRLPDDRGFADLRVPHGGGLDLHRPDPMAGFVVVTPGNGVMRIMPVSVCHHVSTIGQRPPPIVLWYHRHASGLIGSPTVPRRRRLERSCFFGYSSPQRMNARIAVGAVYRIVMSYSSTIRQNRLGSGQSGAPSYMKTLAPFASGPYTMYEWPVTHPMSAVHQNRSSSFRSKTYFIVVATPTRYPPVECWIPFGFPVVPDV